MTKKTTAMSALDRTAYRGRSRLKGVLLISRILVLERGGRFKAIVHRQPDLYQKAFTQAEYPTNYVAVPGRE